MNRKLYRAAPTNDPNSGDRRLGSHPRACSRSSGARGRPVQPIDSRDGSNRCCAENTCWHYVSFVIGFLAKDRPAGRSGAEGIPDRRVFTNQKVTCVGGHCWPPEVARDSVFKVGNDCMFTGHNGDVVGIIASCTRNYALRAQP
jgi:hypothetical protein